MPTIGTTTLFINETCYKCEYAIQTSIKLSNEIKLKFKIKGSPIVEDERCSYSARRNVTLQWFIVVRRASFRCTCSIALYRHTSYTTVKFLLRPLPRHRRARTTGDPRHERISKYFDSFLLSGPALCHGSHDITGSTSAFSNSRSLIPQNSSRPKKKNNHLFDAKNDDSFTTTWRFDENASQHSRIIHSPRLSTPEITYNSFSFSQLGVTRNKKHMVKKKFTTKSRFDYFHNDIAPLVRTRPNPPKSRYTLNVMSFERMYGTELCFCLPFTANEN